MSNIELDIRKSIEKNWPVLAPADIYRTSDVFAFHEREIKAIIPAIQALIAHHERQVRISELEGAFVYHHAVVGVEMPRVMREYYSDRIQALTQGEDNDLQSKPEIWE